MPPSKKIPNVYCEKCSTDYYDGTKVENNLCERCKRIAELEEFVKQVWAEGECPAYIHDRASQLLDWHSWCQGFWDKRMAELEDGSDG